ncbi:hypothetical protein C1646_771828, partial [Rhizophagus diaphanus]
MYIKGCETYRELSTIIKDPDFNPNDVPLSLSTVKKYRNGLPLIAFNSYNVNINKHNTPSTSNSIHQVFIFSLKNILYNILSNQKLCKQLYFGPSIYSDDKQELWHEDIWHKSPLFGNKSIRINDVTYNLGDFIKWNSNIKTLISFYRRIIGFVICDKSNQYLVKVEQIINFNSLPRFLKSRERRNQLKMMWMTEKNMVIEPISIISKVKIWLTDHPIEYIQIQDSPRGLPIYKFFLDIYIDKFGPFRNTYHAIGKIYLQIGNMPQDLRKKHFLLGFIPFGANCNKVLKPLISDIKELENGFEMDLGDKRIWITGGLGDITADLPEGNEQAGIKNHNAKHGYRICTIDYDELYDMSFDLAAGGRYHHNTTLQFEALNNVRTQAERDLLSMQYGIRDKPSIFDNIFRVRHLQYPHYAFHCMGGLANKMLQSTFTILTSKGEESFLIFWKHFEFPNIWSRQQNPITHLNSYFFSDYLRLTMIMPFLIDRTINNNNLLKETFINHV